MTTNQKMHKFLENFASDLHAYRSNLKNDDQRWGFDQAISVFLNTSGRAENAWVWEINHPFSRTVTSITGVSRTYHVEIDNFREKSGFSKPPSYKLMKNPE